MTGLSVIFKAVDEISSKFEAMTSAGTKALDSFDKIENTADSAFQKVVDKTEEASKAMDKASEATDYWTDAIGNYDKGAMEAIYTTQELVNMGFKTEDALQAESDALDKATKDMDELGDKTEETTKKSKKFGDKSTDAVISLQDVIAGAGIVAGLKAIGSAFMECSEAASEFQTNVAMVSTVADTNVLSAEQLSTQISKLSQDTGKSVNEIAEATYNAISAGVDTADAVNTVGEATKLATAGFTSSASALSVLTTAMNAYQLDASEITNISDSLVTSQNLGVLTIDQMASSMGKAISTASAYSVDLYNLESSYISLTKAGISVEESTTYVASMMNELGDAGSDVSKILQEETSMSFGQLMSSGYSLSDVLGVLYNSVEQDSEAFMNLWGSAEAGKAGNAIINQGLETFNTNLGKLANSAGTTQRAYDTMTNTTEYNTQKLKNSMNNLSIAVGNKINPAFSKLKGGASDVIDKFTQLINKYPAITAILTGAAVGIGGVTLAVTGYTAATKIATVASTLFGASMKAALGPLALVATGIAAVTAAVIYMADQEDEAVKAQQTLTSSSMAMEKELEGLQDQYDALVEAGKEDTLEAYNLKNQIDDLTSSFESNKETIGDLISKNEQLKNSLEEMDKAYEDTMGTIDDKEKSSKSLIAQLVSISENSNLTGDQLNIMQGIVDRLNNSYDGLNLTLDRTNGKLNMSVEELWKAVSDASAQEKAQANMDALMDYLGQYQEAQKTYDEANKTMNEARAEYERALDEDWEDEHPFLAWTGWADGSEMNWKGSVKDAYNAWEQAKEATEGATENFDNLDESIRSCYEAMGYSTDEIDDMMGELALASATATEASEIYEQMTEAVENTSDGYEEAKNVIGQYSETLNQLCDDYDKAYEAALQSIDGQYGLWTQVDEVATMSNESITTALQSQINYWNAYNENMASLMDRANDIEGLRDMLAELADGSEDSAAMLAGMESMNDADLSALVQQYNNLQTAQGDTATSIANLETDFSNSLANIQSNMETAVSNMNMSDEAKANAKSTMDAYVSEIEDGVARAQKAINSLSFANNKLSNGDFHGYAVGTKSAEAGLALVGENGPELVNFGGGETVYTADETADILADEPRSELFVAPTSDTDEDGEPASSSKNITLKIEGGGELKVGGGVSKEDVLELMIDNIKDTLMGIIQQEIMEEGDLAYDF